MGGSRQLTWEHMAHRKLRQAICSHKTKTQAHGQQINHQPCAKQDTNTQLMRILISHVFTQDMTTWKHAANEKHKLRATSQNTTHVDRSELETAHSHKKTESCHKTETQDMSAGIQTPCSNTPHTRHADESAHGSSTRETVCSHENRTCRECQGSVTKPWITLDRSDRTLTKTVILNSKIFHNIAAFAVLWIK